MLRPMHGVRVGSRVSVLPPMRGQVFSKLYWWKLGDADNFHEYVRWESIQSLNMKHVVPNWSECAFIEFY